MPPPGRIMISPLQACLACSTRVLMLAWPCGMTWSEWLGSGKADKAHKACGRSDVLLLRPVACSRIACTCARVRLTSSGITQAWTQGWMHMSHRAASRHPKLKTMQDRAGAGPAWSSWIHTSYLPHQLQLLTCAFSLKLKAYTQPSTSGTGLEHMVNGVVLMSPCCSLKAC